MFIFLVYGHPSFTFNFSKFEIALFSLFHKDLRKKLINLELRLSVSVEFHLFLDNKWVLMLLLSKLIENKFFFNIVYYTCYSHSNLTSNRIYKRKRVITGVLLKFGVWLKALAWQLMSSGGSWTIGILAPFTGSVHIASLTISSILRAVSTGALCAWRLSRVHLRSHLPNHARWQPHRKGLLDIMMPPKDNF